MESTTPLAPDKLIALVSQLFGGTSSRPKPKPPTFWDPVFHRAFADWLAALWAARNPGLWEVIHPPTPITARGGLTLAAAELNPQPLPTRHLLMASIARRFSERVELLAELAGATTSDAEKRGIIIVSGHVRRFVEDLIHPDFRLPFDAITDHRRGISQSVSFDFDDLFCPLPIWIWILLHIHFPVPPNPPPDPWPIKEELDGADLIILGASFAEIAKRTFDRDTRHALANAAGQLAEAGAERLS